MPLILKGINPYWKSPLIVVFLKNNLNLYLIQEQIEGEKYESSTTYIL